MKTAKRKARRLAWPARLYLWATERLYHELAWAYDATSWLVSLGQWSRWRALALDYTGGSSVLEVGPGTGELLLEMARRGMRPTALEPSPQMQRVIARKLRHRGLALPRVRARAQALPFSSGSFDAVVSTFPAGYILDPETLAEAERVLRPGGRFVISGLFLEIEQPLLRRLAGLVFPASSEGVTERCREAFTAAGFRVTVVPHRGKWATLPLFILEKESREENGAA